MPVISSNATCLPEVYGNGALYFDPLNVDDMTEKIDLVLTDETLRNDLIARGLRRHDFFSWEKMARKTLAIYKKHSNKLTERMGYRAKALLRSFTEENSFAAFFCFTRYAELCDFCSRKSIAGLNPVFHYEKSSTQWSTSFHGGENRIRTCATIAGIHAFQACAFNHSATSPCSVNSLLWLRRFAR